jgi:death on curing protein
MPADWQYLELGDFLLIAEAVTGIPAEMLGRSERVISQADSALHVPGSGFGNVETYPTFAEKAAILCARIIQNHPLPDGNKRAAFICMVEFIERNGRLLELRVADTADRVADVLVDLATHSISEGEFVDWVAERLQP